MCALHLQHSWDYKHCVLNMINGAIIHVSKLSYLYHLHEYQVRLWRLVMMLVIMHVCNYLHIHEAQLSLYMPFAS